MKSAVIVLAALLCASCGGGSSSASKGPAASDAAPAPSVPAPDPAPSSSTPSSSSTSSSSSSSPSAPSSVSALSYHIIEIPRLAPSGSVTASAVNDQGIVVGNQETSTSPRAWLYQQSSGALDELTFEPSETGASASGISNSGLIAGYEINANTASLQAGFWTATGGAILLTGQYQNFTQASAVNDSGTVIGNYGQSGTVSSQALVWSGPAFAETALPGLRCDYCTRISIAANAINDEGEVAGSSNSSIFSNGQYVSGGVYAVAWSAGAITTLGSLEESGYSAAYGINVNGEIVGSSRVGASAGAPSHAFLFRQGTMTDLGTLSGDTDSSAASINDADQIVGQSENTTLSDTSRAFLYQNGKMYDLNSLIDPTDPLAGSVTLEEAVSISSNGWIAVNGTDASDPGWQRAFLLIPSTPGA
jgi:probable HAF family extracellular repeat protein